MMWNYSGNPGTSPRDTVRFLIGDTNPNEPLLQDGEILWLLSQCNQSAINASVRACEAIASQFARMCDESIGSEKITYSQKSAGYLKMRDELRSRLAVEDISFYAGGISKIDNSAIEHDSDRVRPDFTKDMMETHGVQNLTQTIGTIWDTDY